MSTQQSGRLQTMFWALGELYNSHTIRQTVYYGRS